MAVSMLLLIVLFVGLLVVIGGVGVGIWLYLRRYKDDGPGDR